MPLAARWALAFALSLVAAGALQQAIMAGEHGPLSALPPLAAGVALISVLFALVVWRRRTARAIGLAAAALAAVMLALGAAIAVLGVLSLSPGFGGNIAYGIALIVDFYFLVPASVAVPIHWFLLRTQPPL
jgi:hypothetical protein